MDTTGEWPARGTGATGAGTVDRPGGPSRGPSSDPLATLYEGMSCPQYGLGDAPFEEVAVGFSRRVTERFLAQTHRTLTQHGDGLIDVVREAMEQELPFTTAWSPVFGALGTTLRGQGHIQPREAAARLGLWLAACGHPGRWEVALEAPVRLLWGQWLLPAGQHMRVESDGRVARVILQAPDASPSRPRQRIVELVREAGDARPAHAPYAWTWAESPGPCAPMLHQERHPVLFLFDAVAHAPELSFLRDDVLPSAQTESVLAQYRAAMDILRQHAPVYLPWVDRVMRYVIPLRPRGKGLIESGSCEDQPGMSHITFDTHAVALAEMLAHEASHQYFHLAIRLGPAEDGSDTRDYYSPIKGCGRPIHFILLAYHAFANVMLFYRACRASGCPDPDGYLAHNESVLLPQLRMLDEALQSTRALTRLGHGLWAPLRERLG